MVGYDLIATDTAIIFDGEAQMKVISSRTAFLDRMVKVLGDERESILDMIHDGPARVVTYSARDRACNIRNEANLSASDNIGGTADAASNEAGGASAAAPAAPEAGGDDDGGGDGDPEPERRPRTRKTRTRNILPAAGSLPTTSAATPAPPHLDTLPDAAFVRLPEVCRLYAIAPATAWRWVKAGKIPTPLKLSDRVTAWRVGDLRASLAQLAA